MIDDGPETRSRLATALHVPRWVDEVASGCPYPSLDALVGVADLAARTLTPAEVDQALAAHPRIGEKATGPSSTAGSVCPTRKKRPRSPTSSARSRSCVSRPCSRHEPADVARPRHHPR